MKNLLTVLLFSILATCSVVSVFVIIKENKPLLLLFLSVFAFILSFFNIIIVGMRGDQED